AAVAVPGDPCIGIEVSRHVRPFTFQALSTAVSASRKLREALERIARYNHLIATVVGLATAAERDGAYEFTVVWEDGHPQPAPEALDALFATIVRTSRVLIDRSVAPLEVRLQRPEPVPSEAFRRFFRCPVHFECPDNRLIFDLATVETLLPEGNPELAEAHDAMLGDYLGRLEAAGRFAGDVRRVLIELLPGGEPTETAVARALNMSSRSLQRRLHDEGLTFRGVLCGLRCELAKAQLRAGGHS